MLYKMVVLFEPVDAEKSLSALVEPFKCRQLFSSTYCAVVLFVVLYKVGLTFESVDEIMTIPMKVTGQNFFVCCMLCSFNHSRLCKNPKKYNVTNYRF